MRLSEEQIKERQDKMDNEPTIYAWSTTTFAIGGGEAKRWQKLLAALFIPGVLSLTCFLSLGASVGWSLSALIIGIQVVGGLSVYYLVIADSHFEYRLTRLGLESSREEAIPKATFKVIRGLAWFGVAVCLVAVVLMGPFALVGAGGFALMSFKFTGFKKQRDIKKSVFSERMIIFNVLNNNSIWLMSSPVVPQCRTKIYFNNVERADILAKLKKVLPNAEYVECSTENEMHQNPLLIEAVILARELNAAERKQVNDDA